MQIGKKRLIQSLDGKKILIWGYGREGQSTENFLKRFCNCARIDVFEGKPEELNSDDYDLVIKSPGIVYLEDNAKITAATDLFLEAFRDQTIGITGTKGKSTTSAMLSKVLSDCSGKPVILMGNIGKPCLDYFDDIDEDTIIVFEMSCHQLARVTVAPHVAVFLNLFEEHLDYYKTLDKYFEAKSHITTLQVEGDLYFCGSNVPEITTKATVCRVSADARENLPLKIFGLHNEINAHFVRLIAQNAFGCDAEKVSKSICEFEGLPHRLSYVGTYADIKWYDDSISTIPEAAIGAADSIPGVETLLIGGMDRGIHYRLIEDFILERKDLKFVLMYATGKRIYEELSANEGFDDKNVFVVADLAEAINKAAEVTKKGKGVALSPAAASYGYFKNFEERGEVFTQMVKEL